MTVSSSSRLKGAALVDFTGTVENFKQIKQFGPEFVQLIRSDKRPHAIVVIDRDTSGTLEEPALVRDHLNLTGTSPLLGPNDPAGERFPVVQDIYIEDHLSQLPRVVAAGIKHGVKPDAEDVKNIKKYGADVACYNVVPAMLIAAHARCQVLAVLLPEKGTLPQEVLKEILNLTGEGK